MANQQIHQLQGIDSSEYSPLNDSLLIHKPILGTYQGNIQNLLQAQSVDLPGTRSWNWKFLDKPLTLAGYHASRDHFSKDFNFHTIPAEGDGTNRKSLTATYKDDAIRRQTPIFTADIDPSKIPYEANNLLCVAFVRNCDLYFDNGRGMSLVSSDETVPDVVVGASTQGGTRAGGLLTSAGANGKPTEKIFIVRNVPLPVDVRADGKNEYGDPVPINFKANSFRFLVDATHRWSIVTVAVEAFSSVFYDTTFIDIVHEEARQAYVDRLLWEAPITARYKDGVQQGMAVKFNPNTGDYVRDSNGNIQEYSPEGEIIIGEGHIGGSLTTSDAGIRAGTRDGVSDNLFSRSVNILETVGDTVRDVTGTVVNVVRDVGVRSYETVGRLGSGVRDVITTGVNTVGGAVKGFVNFIFGNWSQSLPLNPASDIIIDYETLGGASIDPYNPKRSSVVSRSTSLDQDFLIHDIAGINKRVKVNIANQNLGFYDASSETINFASELIKKTALDLSSPSYSREYQDDKSRALEAQYSAPLVKTAWGAMSWEVFYIKCIAYN